MGHYALATRSVSIQQGVFSLDAALIAAGEAGRC